MSNLSIGIQLEEEEPEHKTEYYGQPWKCNYENAML